MPKPKLKLQPKTVRIVSANKNSLESTEIITKLENRWQDDKIMTGAATVNKDPAPSCPHP